MPDRFFLANTFTSEPLEGGSAGVFILAEEREFDWMLRISRALNLTDAAFLIVRSPNRFNMRYLGGFMELDFGVSGALAAAHVLYERGIADKRRSIAFFTHGGVISATHNAGRIELIFPQIPFDEVEPPEQILQGIDPGVLYVGKRGNDYMVQISTEARLRKIQPEFHLLDPLGMHGLIVTSTAAPNKDYDFIFRTFQPWPRNWSDTPIASTAYLSLAPFWLSKLAKPRMKGFRSGPRGRSIELELDHDRLKIFGQAVTILDGELKIS